MRVLILTSSLFIATTALQAAPMPFEPFKSDMVVKVVDSDGEKAMKKKRQAGKKGKPKHPAIMALREKYKARRQAAKGDKAAMMALRKEFKAEAKALRQELGLKMGKKGKGKKKNLAEEI